MTIEKCRLKPGKRLSDGICPDGISNIFLPARDAAVGRDIQSVPLGEIAAVQINNPPDNGFLGVDFGDFIADLSDGDNVTGNEPPLFVGDNFENRRDAADAGGVDCAVGGKVAAAVGDEAVAVKFDGASNVRPLPEYDIRAGIDGKPCKLDDVAPVFPIEDFGIERQVFRLFPFRAAVEHYNDDVGFLFGFGNQFSNFGIIVQFDGGKVGGEGDEAGSYAVFLQDGGFKPVFDARIFDVQFVKVRPLCRFRTANRRGQALGASCRNGIPVLPIDGSNPAPVSNTGDVDGQDAPDEKTADTVSIIGVGDIMLGSNYPVDYLPDTNILKNVESALQDADITVGNLEGTLFDEGGTPKKCANPQNMLCIPNALRIRAIPCRRGIRLPQLRQQPQQRLRRARHHGNGGERQLFYILDRAKAAADNEAKIAENTAIAQINLSIIRPLLFRRDSICRTFWGLSFDLRYVAHRAFVGGSRHRAVSS